MDSLDVIPVSTLESTLATWVLVLMILAIFTVVWFSGESPLWSSILFSVFLLVVVASAVYSILEAWRGSRAVKEVTKILSQGGLGRLGELELYEVNLEGFYTQPLVAIAIGGRATSRRRYEVKVDLKPLGRITGSSVDIRGLASGNTALIMGSGEGILRGRILAVRGKNVYLVPLPATSIIKSISEGVGDVGDFALFKVDIDGCRISGSVNPVVRRRARSYKVEVVASVKGEKVSVESPTIVYSGSGGGFQAQLGLCKDTILVIPGNSLNPQTLYRALEGRILATGVDKLLAIGDRSDILTIKLSIDIPLAKDITKEIPLRIT